MDSVNKYKFPEVYCSNCGQQFGPGDSGFSHCESHAGLFSTEVRSYGPADWARSLDEIKAEASAQAMSEIEEKRRYITRSKKPAEDLWSAILAAHVKFKEAEECFLDLSEMAWELVVAEQQRAKEK